MVLPRRHRRRAWLIVADDTGTPDPILVHCEGSGCLTHYQRTGVTMCAMCGEIVPACGMEAIAEPHTRRDLLAMIARGDFDG